MATSIGSWALQLLADPSNFTAGMRAVSNSLGATVALAVNQGNTIATAIKSGITGFASNLTAALDNPANYLASKLSAIPQVGKLLALPLEGIGAAFEVYKKGADRILEMGKSAQKLGMDLRTYQTFSVAAKGDTDAMERSMFHLSNSVATASMAALGAHDPFAKLGLSGRALADLPLPQQFAIVSDRIKDISNPVLQAKIAFDLMGRSALDTMGMIRNGSAGLGAAAGKVDKFGLGVSDQDLANVRLATESAKQLDLAWQGVKNQITIGIAPILAEISASFSGSSLSAKGLSETVQDVAKWIAYAGAVGVEQVKVFDLMWTGFVGGAKYAAATVLMMAESGIEAFESIVQALQPVTDAFDAIFGPAVRNVGMAFGYLWDKAKEFFGWVGEKFSELFSWISQTTGMYADATVAAAGEQGSGKLAEWRAKLVESANQDAQAVADKWGNIGSSFGKIDEFFNRIKERSKETGKALAENNPAANMAMFFDRAKAVVDGLRSPLDEFQAKAAELQTLFDKGLLSQEQYQQALAKSFGTLDKAMGGGETKRTGAMEENSAAAYSTILKNQGGNAGASVQEQIKGLIQAQLEVQRRQEETGRQVAAALGNLGLRGI